MLSYYNILGVPENASDDVIKAAFKQKAVKYHPDKNPNNPDMEEKFKEINRAYQVLSNPYEKARYDLQMKYGAFQAETFYHEPAPPPRREPAKPYNYAEKEIDWRENWIATAYAFGFTFIVAIVVMTVIGIKNYYDLIKKEELLVERRELFNDALERHAEGDLDATFTMINKLGAFADEESDMEEFKVQLTKDVIVQSQQHFDNEEFQEAIYYYELIENHTTINKLSFKENLAVSYRESNQPKKSVQVLMKLLVLGYRNLRTYVELAKIHRDLLNDDNEAIRYFELANGVAKEYYTSIYGKAYPIVLTKDKLSEVHWELYNGLAQLYLKTEDYEKAIKATEWNIRVWQDRPESYFIASEAHEKLGQLNEACEQYFFARTLDPDLPAKEICI